MRLIGRRTFVDSCVWGPVMGRLMSDTGGPPERFPALSGYVVGPEIGSKLRAKLWPAWAVGPILKA